jgi:hypothetical protein
MMRVLFGQADPLRLAVQAVLLRFHKKPQIDLLNVDICAMYTLRGPNLVDPTLMHAPRAVSRDFSANRSGLGYLIWPANEEVWAIRLLQDQSSPVTHDAQSTYRRPSSRRESGVCVCTRPTGTCPADCAGKSLRRGTAGRPTTSTGCASDRSVSIQVTQPMSCTKG